MKWYFISASRLLLEWVTKWLIYIPCHWKIVLLSHSSPLFFFTPLLQSSAHLVESNILTTFMFYFYTKFIWQIKILCPRSNGIKAEMETFLAFLLFFLLLDKIGILALVRERESKGGQTKRQKKERKGWGGEKTLQLWVLFITRQKLDVAKSEFIFFLNKLNLVERAMADEREQEKLIRLSYFFFSFTFFSALRQHWAFQLPLYGFIRSQICGVSKYQTMKVQLQ